MQISIEKTIFKNCQKSRPLTKYQNLTKNNIQVCKDCGFRYIFTDCRAYTEQTHYTEEGLDISKPLKCGYNPYTGEWEKWSTNPLKQKTIEYYGMRKIL